MFAEHERNLTDILIYDTNNLKADGSTNTIYRRAATMFDPLIDIVTRANSDGTQKFTGIAEQTLEELDDLTLLTDCIIDKVRITSSTKINIDDFLYLGGSDNLDQDLNTDPTSRMKVGWVSGQSKSTGLWKARITTKVN